LANDSSSGHQLVVQGVDQLGIVGVALRVQLGHALAKICWDHDAFIASLNEFFVEEVQGVGPARHVVPFSATMALP
jgi:hypothetical protein